MSRFFSEKYAELEAYVPGEQPRDQQYVKLNTNENAYPPHPAVAAAAEEAARKLQLYSDNECTDLRAALAERLGLTPEELIISNGSDEVLNFAFMAFCDSHIPAVFPDITYGFYPVFAKVNLSNTLKRSASISMRKSPVLSSSAMMPRSHSAHL